MQWYTLKTANVVLYVNELYGGKKGWPTLCFCPLMPAANHGTGMEKCQTAISSSSERDEGALLTHTP